MNMNITDNLLKLGVGLQNAKTTDLGDQFGKVAFALFKHLVQGVLIITVGAATFILVDQTAWSVASIPLALVTMVAAIKFFYFTAATGTVLATTQAVTQVQQHFSDDVSRSMDPMFSDEITNHYHDHNDQT